MDDRRTAHRVTDAELDRAIGRALRVDPSPEFVARVRTRVANQPMPSRWTFGWWPFAAVAAAAAIVLIAVVVQRRAHPAGASQARAILSARTIVNDPRTLPFVSGSHATSFVTGPARGSTSSPRAMRGFARPEPVEGRAIDMRPLIDPRESQALRAVIARVRAGGLDLSPVLTASKPEAMDLPPITDIVIEPLAIDPLAPDTGAQGVRQ